MPLFSPLQAIASIPVKALTRVVFSLIDVSCSGENKRILRAMILPPILQRSWLGAANPFKVPLSTF
jgi:hypothetical protein